MASEGMVGTKAPNAVRPFHGNCTAQTLFRRLEDTFLANAGAGAGEAAHRTRHMRTYIEELEREMPEARL